MTLRTTSRIHRYGVFYFFIDSKCMILKTAFVEEGVAKKGSEVMVRPVPQESALKAEIIDLSGKRNCLL